MFVTVVKFPTRPMDKLGPADQAKFHEYLDLVKEYMLLTYGESGAQRMKTREGVLACMQEYNEAYEAFVYKYLHAPAEVQQAIREKLCGDVYAKIRANLSDETIPVA